MEVLEPVKRKSVQELYRPVANIQYPPLPTQDDFYSDNYAWWVEQSNRCKHGYIAEDGKFINPIYYFYLNFVTVQYLDAKSRKVVEGRPKYTVKENVLFDKVYYGMANEYQNAEDLIVAKARGKRWSYGVRAICLWHFVIGQGGDILYGTDSEKTATEAYNKFVYSYRKLPAFFKHKMLSTDKKLEVGKGEIEVDDYGKESIVTKISVRFAYMDKTVGVFQGTRAIICIFDEFGKYTNGDRAFELTKDCLSVGSYKYGQFLIGGTSDAISNKSTYYKDLFFKAKENKFIKHTIFADELDIIDDETGLDNREQSRKNYLARRKLKEETKDYQGLYMEIQNNPLNESELFMSITMSNFPKDKIDSQLSTILMNNYEDKYILCGTLDVAEDVFGDLTDVCSLRPDNIGHWKWINEAFPEPDLTKENSPFLITADDFKVDESADSDSLGCILVWKKEVASETGLSDLPVAFYLYRPSKRTFHVEVAKAIKTWKCDIFAENNDESMVDYLREVGLFKHIVHHNGKPFIRNSTHSISNQVSYTEAWFERNGHERVFFKAIMESLQKPLDVNSDLRSCFLLMMQLLEMKSKRIINKNNQKVNDKPKEIRQRKLIRRQLLTRRNSN